MWWFIFVDVWCMVVKLDQSTLKCTVYSTPSSIVWSEETKLVTRLHFRFLSLLSTALAFENLISFIGKSDHTLLYLYKPSFVRYSKVCENDKVNRATSLAARPCTYYRLWILKLIKRIHPNDYTLFRLWLSTEG